MMKNVHTKDAAYRAAEKRRDKKTELADPPEIALSTLLIYPHEDQTPEINCDEINDDHCKKYLH